MRYFTKVVLVTTLTLYGSLSVEAAGYCWPEVKPFRKSFYFPDAAKAAAIVYISGQDGKPLYLLECHAGLYSGKDSDYIDKDFDYSGDFHCQFRSLRGPKDYRDLLHDAIFIEKEWWSRGRMLADQLWGNCSAYPEYGAVRQFRLRGMHLTLKFDKLEFAPSTQPNSETAAKASSPQLKSFGFQVEVQSDPTALSAIAEPVPFAEPPLRVTSDPEQYYRDCDKVIPQHVHGIVSREYLQDNGLQPPYSEILPGEKTFLIRRETTAFEYSDNTGRSYQDSLTLPILDTNGRKAYEFKCSRYPGSWYTYFVINCELLVAGKKLNLLEHSVDPYSQMGRNIVLPVQLYNNCATYPEWGALRQFKLRGFTLTLQFKQMLFSKTEKPEDFYLVGGLEQATLNVKVESDRSAMSPVAMRPKYIYWGFLPRDNPCATVLADPK